MGDRWSFRGREAECPQRRHRLGERAALFWEQGPLLMHQLRGSWARIWAINWPQDLGKVPLDLQELDFLESEVHFGSTHR